MKGDASLNAFADCRARAAALKYLKSMVYYVVGVYFSLSSPFALDLLTLLLHARTDPIYLMSGTSRVCLRRPVQVTPINVVSLPTTNMLENWPDVHTAKATCLLHGCKNKVCRYRLKKVQKKRPQPEIESGTSCNFG